MCVVCTECKYSPEQYAVLVPLSRHVLSQHHEGESGTSIHRKMEKNLNYKWGEWPPGLNEYDLDYGFGKEWVNNNYITVWNDWNHILSEMGDRTL